MKVWCRKKNSNFVFLIFFILGLLTACSRETEVKPIPASLAQMNSPMFSIGVPQGAASMTAVEQKFPKCKVKYFQSVPDGYLAVKHGKIDAFAFDRHTLQYVAAHNPDLALINEKVADERIVVGSSLKRKDLIEKVNAFIRKYRADGTYQDMYSRWILGKNTNMPPLPEPQNPTITLRIGTNGENEPMNFYSNGELTGFDIEFIKRLALFLNAKVVYQTMEFSALVIATATGKVDLLVADLNATEERRKKILFSDSYLDTEVSMIAQKDRLSLKASSGMQGITDIGKLDTGRVGLMTGSVAEHFMATKYPKAQVSSYDNIADAVTALQGRKLDYVITAHSTAVNFAKNNSDLTILPDQLILEEIAIGVAKGNEHLLKQLNDVLGRFKKNGSLDRLINRWIKTDNSEYKIPPIPRIKKGKILKVGISANREPMNFILNNNYAGVDCELIERIAYELGMRVEFYDMQFSSLIMALQSGKVDVVISNLSSTRERKEKINFTEKYFDNPQVAMIKKAGAVSGITDVSQLAGKKVGIITGSSYDNVLKKQLPKAVPVYFNSVSDQTEAVKAGKLAGFLVDEPMARDIMNHTSGITYIKTMLTSDGYAFAFAKNQAGLQGEINTALKEMIDDGSIKKLQAKWFGKDDAIKVIPEIKTQGGNGIIRLAAYSGTAPFAYVKNGKLVGYDIEIARTIALKLGRTLEAKDMEFSALIPSLLSGKNDMIVGGIVVTEERAKSVLFSIPNYKGGVVVMVAESEAGKIAADNNIWSGLLHSFRRTFIVEDRYKMVLQGFGVTIIISLFSAIFGTVLGFVVCLLRRAKTRWANIPAKVFIRTIQGTPIVVLLMILYYIVFSSNDVNAIIVAVTGFSINFAAYVSEMMRTGIDAVDRGQQEAAYAIGFNRIQVFTKIIFPQAARHVLPVFKGEFISMVKMTSIVGYIAIQDLTKISDIIRSRTYEAFFPLIATALIYFVIAYAMTYLLTMVEIRIDPKQRKRIVKGVVNQ